MIDLTPPQIAQKINYRLERMLPFLVPFGAAIGFLLPSVFVTLRHFVPYLFAVMTFSGALKLRTAELAAAVKNPVPIVLFFIAAHILMPVITMFVSSFFLSNNDVVAGFVVLFSAPTAVSGFIWVSILKGDMALCLTLVLLDTLLAPVIMPGTVAVLMGTKVAINMSGIVVSLLLMVVIPTILGVAINETSKGKFPGVICPYLDPCSKITLMMVIAANTASVAPGIRLTDPFLWKVAVICIILIAVGFLLAKITAVIGRYNREKSVTLIISGGLRNNSAVATILVAFFPEAAVLPALLGIVFQQIIAAIAGKIMAKKTD